MAHAVVRTDKMFGTDNRAGMASARYYVDDVTTDIDNGNVLKVTELEDGSREVYVGETPTASDEITDIILVASPEVMYDERLRNLDEFYNAAGDSVRGYHLHINDIFSVTKDALDGVETPAVGDVVELQASTKLNVVAASTGATSGSTVVGKIIDVKIVGRYTYYAIQVA